MIMATHDLRLASKVADQVLFLDGGVIVESGTAKEHFPDAGAGTHEEVHFVAEHGERLRDLTVRGALLLRSRTA